MAIVEGPDWLYIGETNSNDDPHGKGEMRFRNGDHYAGYFKDGYREGFGKYVFSKGETEYYEGEYHLGKREGSGTIKYRNGDSFSGYFKEGKKNGYGTYYKNISGRTESYYGQYHMGLKFGKFTKTDTSGRQSYYYENEWQGDTYSKTPTPPPSHIKLKSVMQAELDAKEYAKKLNPCDRKSAGIDKNDQYKGPVSVLGKPHGKGLYRYDNGDAYDGEFSFGRLSGVGSYFFNSGGYYKGKFYDGLFDGEGYYTTVKYGCAAEKYKSHITVKGTWRNGVILKGEIIYKKYGEESYNTEKYEGDFAPGTYLPHGRGRYTEKDGSYYEGAFELGVRQGYGKYFKNYDRSVYQGEWKGGLRHGTGSLTYPSASHLNKVGRWENDVFIG